MPSRINLRPRATPPHVKPGQEVVYLDQGGELQSVDDQGVVTPVGSGEGGSGVMVDNQDDPPAEITTLIALGATISGDEATLPTVGDLQSVVVTLDGAQIADLASGVELVPAIADKILWPVQCALLWHAGGSPPDPAAGNLILAGAFGVLPYFQSAGVDAATTFFANVDRWLVLAPVDDVHDEPATNDNLALLVDDTAPPDAGGGTLDVFLIYRELDAA